MRKDTPQASSARPERPLKLLLVAAVISLLFGAFQLGEPFEDALRVARNSLHTNQASGDIVFVEVDDASLRDIGEWPWPRSVQAKMIDESRKLGVDRIFLDMIYDSRSNPTDDAAFAAAIERSGRVTLPVRTRFGSGGVVRTLDSLPLPMFRKNAALASITSDYNYQHAVLKLPFSTNLMGAEVPTFAASLASHASSSGQFRLDYSIDVRSVPILSAASILRGRVPTGSLAGKTIVIGQSADQLGDQYWIPGEGRMAGSYVQIIAAETLKRGAQVDLGWLAPLIAATALCGWALSRPSLNARAFLLAAVAILLLVGPVALERNLIFVDVVPALLAVALIAGRLGWKRWKNRGLTNSLSGLPNLDALRSQGRHAIGGLVAARVHNYAEIASALSDPEESEVVRQIADRLRVANRSQEIYQGDEGIFAWLVDGNSSIGNHLEALHALFRSPVNAGGRSVDVAISFGAEMGGDRSLANRLGSALVAADEAWTEGLRWKLHDPAREQEVNWRLSLLSRLDSAIDTGEVWLAYQPQVDLRTGRIVGAEALARWTHPDKGPISPSEFIAAAEAHGRISKLTDFVLDRAISTASAINRRGTPFNIAVNLSARLLVDKQFIDRVSRMLSIHGLKPEQLTLELTETAAITETDHAIALLDQLKALGTRIAIDDYGTGLSTLDYLKKVPADEIKIDQSFVRSIRVNRSDLIMVQSTIALAHSLGRKVVAEGVEDQQVLEDLRRLDCDLAQGFVVGRPMGVRELIARLAVRQEKQVA
jgi:EAL domain-containing protein (putative c-di-GMP-specific phosphodiesterase class I)/CHASE2 domain-containing sensor protein